MLKSSLFIVVCVWYGASLTAGRTCKENFGGCDKSNGLCWDTAEGTSFCTCKSGYRFRIPSTRKGKCVNINECCTGLHTCDTTNGKCLDTFGSHRCVCNKGYVLDYTQTKCLRLQDITGRCQSSVQTGRRRKFTLRRDSLFDHISAILGYGTTGHTEHFQTCKCESGYELRNGCQFCQDINECKRRTSKCDLKLGYCHNSHGGYYCTCKAGYVLGPCGFKCFKPSKRPEICTSDVFKASSLIKEDSNGLNDEASRAVLYDQEIEKAVKAGTTIRGSCTSCDAYQSLLYSTCRDSATIAEVFDIDRDGTHDITVKYVCVRGPNVTRWVAKSVVDKEAYWTPWTCWTECKPTCSGGIQTRSRICKHGLVGEGRCAGPATRYKTCYHGPMCKIRVRRNAATLTEVQKKDLIQAMEKYKKDTSTFGFHNAAGTHVFPNQCMGKNGKRGGCCYHDSRLNFIIWHRAELLNFEEGLTRHLKDKTLGLPYWDWLQDPEPPSLAWSKTLYGKKNPFANVICRFDTKPPSAIQRSPKVAAGEVDNAKNTYYSIVQNLMRAHTIHEFSEALENSHNWIHGSVCSHPLEACSFSMANLTYAAFDPLFFFHHTNVDRLFSVLQQYMENSCDSAWTRQSVLEPQENILHFNEPYQPFRNRTLTPFKRLHTLSNIQDLFYYRNMLGYTYDTLYVPPEPSQSRGDVEKDHVPAPEDQLLLAQYEKSIKTNVKISYYLANRINQRENLKPCSQLSESDARFLGTAQILGSKDERPWKSSKPTILNVNQRLFGGGEFQWVLHKNDITPTTNIKVTACYTLDTSCNANCTQVSKKVQKMIPSPQLLLYPKNIKIDVFKFEWDKSKRLPDWQLNIGSGSQWVMFWGREARNIIEVDSRSKYLSCDPTGGIKFHCRRPVILPNGIHYFIHKNKAECLKGLKLNLLASI